MVDEILGFFKDASLNGPCQGNWPLYVIRVITMVLITYEIR